MARIALFGGSFDPIHEGHVAIATAAQKACELDIVHFIPACQSPFKEDEEITAGEHRLAMCELAVADLPWAKVNSWEVDDGDISYSWQTAVHFTGEMDPSDELFWILGADQWEEIENWSRAPYLAALVKFIAFPRGKKTLPEKDGFPMEALTETHPASATSIRNAIRDGKDPKGLDPKVAAYIEKHRLYI